MALLAQAEQCQRIALKLYAKPARYRHRLREIILQRAAILEAAGDSAAADRERAAAGELVGG